MRRRLSLLTLALLAACHAPGAGVGSPRAAPVARKDGALLLASPGRGALAFVVAGAPQEIVRGRVRWHLDADGGATRLRAVTREPTTIAARLPPWLGGGIALLSDGGVTLAEPGGTLRAVLRGGVTAPAIGAHELWLRARGAGGGDWVRLELAGPGTPPKARAIYAPPPIAAPLLSPWTVGPSLALLGRSLDAGPEFVSPKVAFALVDLLGPVLTRDGGETWSALELPTTGPPPIGAAHLVRVGNDVALADDGSFAVLSATGQVGPALPLPSLRDVPPETAALRLETSIVHGVSLDDGRVVLSDGGRLAIATLDPLRVVRVGRAVDLTRCDLRPASTGGGIALAACARHDEGPSSAGAQLVIGTVDDGAHGPQLAVERAVPMPTGHRFSASGALAIAGACAPSEPAGGDLEAATRLCVRDGLGRWRESIVAGISGRLATAPRLDGGLVFVHHDAAHHLELVATPAAATATSVPARLRLDAEPTSIAVELLGLDEVAPGRFVVWRKVGEALEGMTVTLEGDALRLVARSPGLSLDADAQLGLYGEHALVAATVVDDGRRHLGAVRATRDGGAHWETLEWPDSARILEPQPSGRLDCGALGCRLFGWTRVGWQRAVASADAVTDLAGAPELPALPDAPVRATTLDATCAATAPSAPFDPARVPLDRVGTFVLGGAPAKDALLGLPEPKLAVGLSLDRRTLGLGAVRGALLAWGPTSGAWGDLGRLSVRFTTDLDPIGTAHETAPTPAPFADRVAAQRALYDVSSFALAPGRILVVGCELGHCASLWRATAAQPLERIDLSAAGDVTHVINARELGDTMMIVGLTMGHDAVTSRGAEIAPFVALVGPNGVAVARLGRAGISGENSVVGTIDAVRGRFGLATYSPLPTWDGGTTYVMPLRADAQPIGAFEPLGPSPSELARPDRPCAANAAGWDHGDTHKTRTVALTLGGTTTTLSGDGATIRERLTSSGPCLERFTLLGPKAAFQLEPSTGDAVLLSIEADGKKATKQTMRCTARWTRD